MIASATFYLAFTRKIYVACATRCHICPKMTVSSECSFGSDHSILQYVPTSSELTLVKGLSTRVTLPGRARSITDRPWATIVRPGGGLSEYRSLLSSPTEPNQNS